MIDIVWTETHFRRGAKKGMGASGGTVGGVWVKQDQ